MQKELYFTPGSLRSKSQALLADVERLRCGHDKIRFRSGNAALLVLDMQEYFLQPDSHAFVPPAPAIVEGISRLRTAFLAASRPVVFTRHVNTAEDAGMMSIWWRELISPHTARSHIVGTLETSNCILITARKALRVWLGP